MTGRASPECTIVIPVYRNEASLPELLSQLDSIADYLATELQAALEVVFVVDGSPDNSLSFLRGSLQTRRFKSQVCAHSRNFGSFAAIRTGLAKATGQYFVVMAADLQEPPALARQIFAHLLRGDADIAVATRESREDPLLSRLASALFWGLYRRLVMAEIPAGGVDVFGCSEAPRAELLRLQELNTSLIGQLFWVGFQRVYVPYRRLPRPYGVSAWTLSRKVRYMLDSIYSFSDLPIRILKWVGALSVCASVVFAAVVLVARLLGQINVPGYTATVLTFTFFGGLNALGLGVVGEYVWRTFENTKGRAGAIVQAVSLFSGRVATQIEGKVSRG